MGWAARGRRRAGVWYEPGLDRADHDRHPSFISDALGVSTRKVKTTTEELCGRTFSGQHGQPGQTVCCTALRRTGSTRRIRIWCMYATRNTTRIGPYARDPRWIAPLPPAALRRGGSPARPVHPVRGRPSVRRGRPPGRRTGPWALVNEAFAKRFGGGRRTVVGTRLQITAIDVDDQGREIASASWSTCGHAGVTATAPTVFVPVERGAGRSARAGPPRSQRAVRPPCVAVPPSIRVDRLVGRERRPRW